ncbi:Alpha-adducin [Symbiodinium microadriaticum]|uniref:Alpha-adducin n=1 Tax=Symbiodinium microadriaticum TaxID=2951 RepID=A0A1Q9ELJ8_SYMMI|nr:Alpha-adducin [Symbiodinium microadriaticum]
MRRIQQLSQHVLPSSAAAPSAPADLWEARCKLAIAYRLSAHYGWDELVFNHITLKVPESDRLPGGPHFLINPFGLRFDEVTASSLLKVDLDGNIVDKGTNQGPLFKQGFVVHSAVHAARPDITCVWHCHHSDTVAVLTTKAGFLPLTQEAISQWGEFSYHPFEGNAVDLDERQRMAQNLGPKNKVLLLENHGPLTAGGSVEEAFFRMCLARNSAITKASILHVTVIREWIPTLMVMVMVVITMVVALVVMVAPFASFSKAAQATTFREDGNTARPVRVAAASTADAWVAAQKEGVGAALPLAATAENLMTGQPRLCKAVLASLLQLCLLRLPVRRLLTSLTCFALAPTCGPVEMLDQLDRFWMHSISAPLVDLAALFKVAKDHLRDRPIVNSAVLNSCMATIKSQAYVLMILRSTTVPGAPNASLAQEAHLSVPDWFVDPQNGKPWRFDVVVASVRFSRPLGRWLLILLAGDVERNPAPQHVPPTPRGSLELQSGFTSATAMRKCFAAFQFGLPMPPTFLLTPLPLSFLSLALRAYGLHLYSDGLPRYLLVYAITSAQAHYAEYRGSLGLASQIDHKWQAVEPGECRPVVPVPIIRSLVTLGLVWNLPSFVAVSLIGFLCMLHPSVFLALRGACHGQRPCCFCSFEESKDCDICSQATLSLRRPSRFLEALYEPWNPERALYTGTANTYRSQWNAIMKHPGVPCTRAAKGNRSPATSFATAASREKIHFFWKCDGPLMRHFVSKRIIAIAVVSVVAIVSITYNVTLGCTWQIRAMAAVGGDLSKLRVPSGEYLAGLKRRENQTITKSNDDVDKKNENYNEVEAMWHAARRLMESCHGAESIYC